MNVRDRIVELRRIPAAELQANPKNWRKHPPRQRAVLEAMLGDIGFANAALARVDFNGDVVLIDGHLRQETVDSDFEVPTLILDVTEEEADKLLASLDPIASLAEADQTALEQLMNNIAMDNEHLAEALRAMAESYDVQVGISDLSIGDSAGDHGAGFDAVHLTLQLPKNRVTEELTHRLRDIADEYGAKLLVKGASE